MDLEELKNSWKVANKRPIGVEHTSITSLKDKSSSSPLVKLRKNIFLELQINLVAVLLFFGLELMGTPFKNEALQFYLNIFIAVFVVFYLIFVFRIYNNSKNIHFNESVKEQLVKNISALKKDVNYYVIFNLSLFLPLVYLGSLLIITSLNTIDEATLFTQKRMLIFLGTAIVFAYPYYLLVNWWVDRFYNKYIQQLEKIYQEISTNE